VEAPLEKHPNTFLRRGASECGEKRLPFGTISASGGRLFTSTRRFVSAIACLSNDAILVASASTNASSSASGNARLT